MDARAVMVDLPSAIQEAYNRLREQRVSGQLIINLNGGEPQSFEIKEYYRIKRDHVNIPD